jgi:hypothetical protein
MVKPIFRKVILGLLVVALGIEGLLLLFTGWWLPEAAASLKAVGFGWLFACIATGFRKRRPYVQLLMIFLWGVVSVWRWWTTTSDRSIEWFLYENLFPLVAFGSTLLLVVWRDKTGSELAGGSPFD